MKKEPIASIFCDFYEIFHSNFCIEKVRAPPSGNSRSSELHFLKRRHALATNYIRFTFKTKFKLVLIAKLFIHK